jgi:hypothetical protein
MLLFRQRLLRSLLAKEKISERLVDLLLSWRHPGLSVFQGDPVSPEDHQARERLAGYMAHPPGKPGTLISFDEKAKAPAGIATDHMERKPRKPGSVPCFFVGQTASAL